MLQQLTAINKVKCSITSLRCCSGITMDELRLRALGDFHQKFRTGIIVNNILPEIASSLNLTAVERSQVEAKFPSNYAQVDDLLTILRTKDNWHFDGFCIVLERNGYPHWAKQLREAATTEPNGRRASWVRARYRPHVVPIAFVLAIMHGCLLITCSS